MQFEYKIEQILMDRNISESDPLVKVANISNFTVSQAVWYPLAIPSKVAANDRKGGGG